jgi:ankyrin repeat protein
MIERRDWETHSPLAIAAKSGNYDTVDHLLRIGADPNNNGSTIPALYMAAKYNHEQVCGLLML